MLGCKSPAHQFDIPCPRCKAERYLPWEDEPDIWDEQQEPDPIENPTETCDRCEQTGRISVDRCPNKLLVDTFWPRFIRSFHLWKVSKGNVYPVPGGPGAQAHTWMQAVMLFDVWYEDAMKVKREAEQKRAEAQARQKTHGRRR